MPPSEIVQPILEASSQDLITPNDCLEVNASLSTAIRRGDIGLQDLETVRLLVHGDSVIDWQRLHFQTRDEVTRFLALHLLDFNDPIDQARLQFIFMEAVNYLEEHLSLTFPPDMHDPEDVRDIFIMASQQGGFRRRQILACVILKLMHVINHLESVDLKYRTAVSEAQLIQLAERRIYRCADRMREQGFPLVAFYGSRKARSSVITKLIAKKETIATTIFDKLRFRIITESREDVLSAIAWLSRFVFPFNYIVPGQSHNSLITLAEMVAGQPGLERACKHLQPLHDDRDELRPEPNPFSGSSYRMVNFIVDFPVRIDAFLTRLDPVRLRLLGRTVVVLVEFQILDRETARLNESGENAHYLYKMRQRKRVSARLRRGGLARKG